MTDDQKGAPAQTNPAPPPAAPPKTKPARSRLRRYLPGLLFVAVLAVAMYLLWRIFFATAGAPQNVLTLSGRIEGDPAAVAAKLSGRIL